MAALGATQVDVRFRRFAFAFPNGKLDLTEMDPQLRAGHALAEVDGLPMQAKTHLPRLLERVRRGESRSSSPTRPRMVGKPSLPA